MFVRMDVVESKLYLQKMHPHRGEFPVATCTAAGRLTALPAASSRASRIAGLRRCIEAIGAPVGIVARAARQPVAP